jgi:preprotein translocase subunit SecE
MVNWPKRLESSQLTEKVIWPKGDKMVGKFIN